MDAFEGSSIAGGALDAIDGFQLELKQEEYFESWKYVPEVLVHSLLVPWNSNKGGGIILVELACTEKCFLLVLHIVRISWATIRIAERLQV